MRRSPLQRATGVAKALGHPARLRIISMLSGGGLCVCQMTAILGLAPSTVSAHLSELKQAGLLVETKKAKFVFYELSLDPNAKRWHDLAHAAAREDPQVVIDLDLVRRLRAVPVEEFAAAGAQLSLLPALPPPNS